MTVPHIVFCGFNVQANIVNKEVPNEAKANSKTSAASSSTSKSNLEPSSKRNRSPDVSSDSDGKKGNDKDKPKKKKNKKDKKYKKEKNDSETDDDTNKVVLNVKMPADIVIEEPVEVVAPVGGGKRSSTSLAAPLVDEKQVRLFFYV